MTRTEARRAVFNGAAGLLESAIDNGDEWVEEAARNAAFAKLGPTHPDDEPPPDEMVYENRAKLISAIREISAELRRRAKGER